MKGPSRLEPDMGKNLDDGPGEQATQEEFPDGKEPVYIQAVSDEAEAGNSPTPINFDDLEHFQCAPWLPKLEDAWEFTTHGTDGR